MATRRRGRKRRGRKRRRRRDDDDESRRISQLPKDILHHILSFLPQKDAIKTCVLSKSWRHLGPTRPNVDLLESDFSYGHKKKLFLSALDKTLQTYQEHKHSIRDLHVKVSSLDFNSSSILEKLVKNLNVKTFGLAITDHWGYFPLPPSIFEAESLEEIYLTGLHLKNHEKKVLFKHLRTLHLTECYIEDGIFANIMSSCPLIEYLVLELVHNFRFNYHFPHLKSLCLRRMRLSAESFNNLSSNNYFPCLEELELFSCCGFEEFVLSSRSIKRLIISDMSCKGVIDAAKIVYFEVSNSRVLPPSISLTTTSKEWKSHIDMCHFDSLGAGRVSTWLLNINELLKALSQSQISFKPSYHKPIQENCGYFEVEPAVVEHLDLSRCHTFTSYANILICFFRICRPKFMSGMCPGITAEIEQHSRASCKTKVTIKDNRVGKSDQHYFWQQDLEELSSEVWDGNAKEWHHVQLGTLRVLLDKQKIRYRLKWRGEKTG